ncbi:MAG: hypothetical protein C0608_08780 [Deltaproteobacteria bacterium]|nr:MAG: hypothetical protein C0608_08780 [Deltaproteobacteria bacterium]
MAAFLRKIFIALIIGATVLFAFENTGPLSQEVQFTFDLFIGGLKYEAPPFPVFFLFLAAFLIGLMYAGLHGIYERIARKAENRSLNRKIKTLEAELTKEREKVSSLTEERHRAGIPESDGDEKAILLPGGVENEPLSLEGGATDDEKSVKKSAALIDSTDEEPLL